MEAGGELAERGQKLARNTRRAAAASKSGRVQERSLRGPLAGQAGARAGPHAAEPLEAPRQGRVLLLRPGQLVGAGRTRGRPATCLAARQLLQVPLVVQLLDEHLRVGRHQQHLEQRGPLAARKPLGRRAAWTCSALEGNWPLADQPVGETGQPGAEDVPKLGPKVVAGQPVERETCGRVCVRAFGLDGLKLVAVSTLICAPPAEGLEFGRDKIG